MTGTRATLLGPLAERMPALGVSDPVALGLMQGFPPPPERRIRRLDGMQFPALRWGFCHVRERGPTARVRRGPVPSTLPEGPRIDPADLVFGIDGQPVRLADYLERACVDAFVALHRGRVVIEHYAPHMDAAQPHLWASMTKNVVGVLALQAVHDGLLRLDAPLSTWVPELQGTPIGDATLQQNLDMEVAVGWPAALPPDIGLFAAIGTVPRPDGAPASIAEYVQRCQQPVPFESGRCWYYQNGSPEAVAWAIRRVTGRPLARLLSERLWAPLGCDDDADWIVDETGAEFASGGLATTARDLARFVDLFRTRGRAGEVQVVAGPVMDAMLAPVDNRERFALGHLAPGRPGYAYRNYVYHVNDANRALQGVGRFGQWFHVDPVSDVTLVQFASRPDAAPRPIAPAPLPPLPRPEFEGRWIGAIAQSVAASLRSASAPGAPASAPPGSVP